MIFTATPLEGAFIIDVEPFTDDRGFFTRFFCENEFRQHDLVSSFLQANHSGTDKAGTVRGMHMQNAPWGETKLVKCIKGRIFDVIVDVRATSPTFLQWFGAELSAENKKMMYVPKGFAHGFQTLEDNSDIMYLVSQVYNKDAELPLRYNDPAIGIQWPLPVTVISEKDANAALCNENFKGYQA
jgi:dTDP-4-dehydrorhamnose 3,5-epimerase